MFVFVVGLATQAATAPAASAAQSSATCLKQAKLVGTNGRLVWVPVTTGGSENCLLQTHTEYVAATVALQDALTWCNKASTQGTDGYWGSKTTAAMKKFQNDKGLVADGIYGNKSHNKMLFDDRAMFCDYRPAI